MIIKFVSTSALSLALVIHSSQAAYIFNLTASEVPHVGILTFSVKGNRDLHKQASKHSYISSITLFCN